MIAQGGKLCPNTNIQKNPRERYARSYIKFIQLRIFFFLNARMFSPCNFKDSYNSRHENVFVPAYLPGFLIQFTLYRMPEHIVQTRPVKK